MKKSILLTITALFLSVAASFALSGIYGPSSGCTGSHVFLNDSTVSGGIWTSSDPSVASVYVDTMGYINCVSAGTATITFTTSAGSETFTLTVYPSPAAITGPTSVCVGGTITEADLTPGGVWSISPATLASVSATGVVTGVAAGSATITYATSSGCSSTAYISVTTSGAYDSLSGPSTVCVGSTITISAAGTTGGTWSSSATSVATVSSAGAVTGIAPGTTIISYTVTGSCGSATATYPVTVISGTSAGTIAGPSTVSAGGIITLTDGVAGGTWTSSTTSIATVNPTTGVVTGVAAGTVTISYTVTGCGASSTATYTVTVTPANVISGYVYFPTTPYYGPVKIWLITYVSPNLEAIDSVTLYSSGDSLYYQFLGEPTDSYRVKAAALDSTVSSMGYIPTYHTSSYYWYSADVIAHTAGTVDAHENINMAYGPVTSGPGFIGGNVTTGANKATSGGVPVCGLTVFCVNSTTGQVAQYTHTDASGNYSFSSLPVGTYFIFPDSLNYHTTPYIGITLTTGAPSMAAASFIQHTISKTITPIATGVENISANTTSIVAFPNPTMGKLNIQWNAAAAESATISICDVTGREIYKSNLNVHQGYGSTAVDMTALTNGLYILSVKSTTINYSTKIQVQH